MARRVNTRFVVILVVVVVGLGGVVGGRIAWRYMRNRDVPYLEAAAKAAQQRGDIEEAVEKLTAAAAQATAQHRPDAPDLCNQAAELLYSTTDKHPERYIQAIDFWKKALSDRSLKSSPGYVKAEKRLVKELYDLAVLSQTQKAWADLESEASASIKLDASYGPAYRYRGEAIRRQLVTLTDLTADRQAQAVADLKKAIQLLPDDPAAYEVLARFMVDQATAKSSTSKDEADKLREEASIVVLEFCQKHPTQAQGWLALASLQATMGRFAEATAQFEKAVATDPKDPAIRVQMGLFMADQRKINEAEKCLKEAIALAPEDPQNDVLLARFYMQMRRLPEAVAQFKEAISRKGTGLGAESTRRTDIVGRAYMSLCDALMDMADQAGPTSAAGKPHMEEAAKYIDEFRASRPGSPMLYLLDGRMLMLRGRLADATAQLRRADELMPHWEVKLVLAEVYVRSGEWGLALKTYNQALDQLQRGPRWGGVLLQRGRVQRKLAQWDELLSSMQTVLRLDPGNKYAKSLLVDAYRGLGRNDDADRILQELQADTPEAGIVLARMRILNGEDREALDALEPILAADPTHETASSLAALAYMQLAEKAANTEDARQQRAIAAKLIDQALAKHPESVQLKMFKSRLENPDMKLSELQEKVISTIADEYDRDMAFANFYAMRGDLPKQLDYLVKAEEKRPADADPQSAQPLIERIFTLALVTNNKDLARKYADKAERLKLDGVDGALYKGRVEFTWGDRDAGLQMLRNAVAKRDSSQGHTILGKAYWSLGQMSQARDELVKAIEQKGDNLDALRLAIRVLANQPDQPSQQLARDYLQRGLQLAPGDRDLRAIEDVIGDPKAVIARHELVLKRRPDDMENRRQLGQVYFRAGERAKAIEVLQPVYKQNPDDLVVADLLAQLYQQTNQDSEAMKILQDLVARDNPVLRYRGLLLMGDYYRAKDKVEDARKLYNEALTHQPKGSSEADGRIADLDFDTGNTKEAEARYKRLLDASPADPDLLRRYIDVLLQLKEFARADDLLNKSILTPRPNDPQGLVLRGRSLMLQNKLDEAIRSFNKALDASRQNVEALYLRARCTMASGGDIEQAVADLLQARGLRPDLPEIRHSLALAYRAARRLPEADREYRETLNRWPGMLAVRVEYANFLANLAEVSLRLPEDSLDPYAQVLRQVKPVEALAELLDDSRKRFPNQPTWLIRMGDLFWLQDRREAALQAHELAMRESKNSPEASIAYLNTLLLMKYYDRVIQDATILSAQYPDVAELYIKRAIAYAKSGKQAESLQDFAKALELLEKNLDAYGIAARQMFDALPISAARDYLQKRVDADARNVPARLAAAQAMLIENKADLVEAYVAPLLDSTVPAAVRVAALRQSATAYLKLKQPAKALASYEALLKIQPENLEALNNKAFILASDLKRPADALKVAEVAVKVLRTTPVEVAYVNNGNVLDTYGWVKYLAGDPDGAVTELTRSVQADPSPISYLHLAKVYQAQGRLGDAKRVAGESVRLAAKNGDPLLAEAKALLAEVSKP